MVKAAKHVFTGGHGPAVPSGSRLSPGGNAAPGLYLRMNLQSDAHLAAGCRCASPA